MSDSWRDRVVGARMAVDQEFADRVEGSSFSRQQWGLVMTAVEFEIENPGDPENAAIVANTEKLPSILPELDNIEQQMQPMGGDDSGRSSGVLSGLKDQLGFGNGSAVDESKEREATQLVGEYADALQSHLESTGQWDEVRTIAAEEGD
ncbi:MAG: DUF5799 family protein [Halodesulfurarchaeum sp.]